MRKNGDLVRWNSWYRVATPIERLSSALGILVMTVSCLLKVIWYTGSLDPRIGC